MEDNSSRSISTRLKFSGLAGERSKGKRNISTCSAFDDPDSPWAVRWVIMTVMVAPAGMVPGGQFGARVDGVRPALLEARRCLTQT